MSLYLLINGPMKNKVTRPVNYNNLLDRIANILVEIRTKAVREINKAQVLAYWEIGREIVDFEQKGKARVEYGEELIVSLTKDMTERFGKGFSERNLRNMSAFYLNFPIRQTVSAEWQKSQTVSGKFEPMLSWSHYCELLKVEGPLARAEAGGSIKDVVESEKEQLNHPSAIR
jgi:hypothetical protein